jgi:putative Mg2+ transporter-C (MgtC) family protein
MSTAATLWCSAAVGVLAGSGKLIEATAGAAAILLVHLTLRPVVRRIDARLKKAVEVDTLYRLRVVCREQDAALIRGIFMRHINSHPAMSVQGVSVQDADRPDTSAVIGEIYSSERNDKFMNDLVQRISIEPSVTAVSWERVR